MSPDVILGLIVFLPVVVLMAFRINAALVFLSLCLGDVLVQFVAGDAHGYLTSLAAQAHGIQVTNNNAKIVLLLLPAVLTAVFMIRTVSGSSRLALNVLPAIGVGLLGALLIVPLLPPGLSHNIVRSDFWDQAQKAQDIIVGGSAIVCLFVLWLQRPHAGGHHKLGKHK